MSGQVTPLATSGSGTGAGTVTIPSADSGLFVLDTSSFKTANPGTPAGSLNWSLWRTAPAAKAFWTWYTIPRAGTWYGDPDSGRNFADADRPPSP